MTYDEKPRFVSLLIGLAEYYRADLSPLAQEIYWDTLKDFEYEAIAAASRAHLRDPKAGQYLPKVSDFIRHMEAQRPADGHPEPEEAWNLLYDLHTDQTESGFFTEEIREAWQACSPSLEAGDRVAARMAFLEKYRVLLATARAEGQRPKWTLTQGNRSDPARLQRAVETAVAKGRIPASRAGDYLPMLPASLSDVFAALPAPSVEDYPGDLAPWPGRCKEHRMAVAWGQFNQKLKLSLEDDKRLEQERRTAERADEDLRRRDAWERAQAAMRARGMEIDAGRLVREEAEKRQREIDDWRESQIPALGGRKA